MRGSNCIAAVATCALVGCGMPEVQSEHDRRLDREVKAAAIIDRLEGNALRTALQKLPKGGDLHSDLLGAVSTDRLIEWGASDGDCLDRTSLAVSPPPCSDTQLPLRGALSDSALYAAVLGAWSMEGFAGTLVEGHQHFFDTFDKLGGVVNNARSADAIADILSSAGRNHQSYVELLENLGSTAIAAKMVKYFSPDDAWDEATLLGRRQQMLADPEFADWLFTIKNSMRTTQAQVTRLLACDGDQPDPGCNVTLRHLVGAERTRDRTFVFAQWVFAFELAQVEPTVLGVNLVAPEEDPLSLQFYDDEMFAVDVLRRMNDGDARRHPVHVALEAGALIPDVMPKTPDGQRQLQFHVHHAVEAAHAERISHGVDVLGETGGDGVEALLGEMSDRGVLVEVCLSSNAALLGASGAEHPLHAYRVHRVPVALATDAQGILRIDATDEAVRAFAVQGLRYQAIKQMVRASLEHGFLPGTSLWHDSLDFDEPAAACANEELGARYPTAPCDNLLKGSERARLQWALEADLEAFESALVYP